MFEFYKFYTYLIDVLKILILNNIIFVDYLCYYLSLNWFFILYIILSILALLSALLVILVRNPIHSVLYLILVFLCVGFNFLLLKVEFLAFLFFIVYLGAIAVLFLFVIMMLNIRLVELKENIIRYLPLSSLIFFLFILEFFYLINNTTFLNTGENFKLFYSYKNWFITLENLDNIEVLGTLIYTYYIYAFLLAGIILLLAMLGAIVLTLNQLSSFKRQYYYMQNRKTIYNSIIIFKNVDKFTNLWDMYYKVDEEEILEEENNEEIIENEENNEEIIKNEEKINKLHNDTNLEK